MQQQQSVMYLESDAALVEKAMQGDHATFEVLVSRYHALLYSYLRKQTRNHEQAEELEQTVWLQLFLSLPQLSQYNKQKQEVTSLRPWLLRVASNQFINECRRRHPLCFSDLEAGAAQDDSLEEQLLDPEPLPEEEAERHDLQTNIRAAIDALPRTFQEVVFLRSVKDFSFQEIAHQLQMPESTVRVYFHRASPLLRATLTPFVPSKASQSRTPQEQEG